jgi:hypothetical protein
LELADGFRHPTLLDVHPPQSDVSAGKCRVRPEHLLKLRHRLVVPSERVERPPNFSADLPRERVERLGAPNLLQVTLQISPSAEEVAVPMMRGRVIRV